MAISKKISMIIIVFVSIFLLYMFRDLPKIQMEYKADNVNNLTRFKSFGLDKMRSKSDYHKHCISLYKKLRYPDPNLIIRPEIPPEMFDDFTDHGDMTLKDGLYFNEAYSDSTSGDTSKISRIIDNKTIEAHFYQVKNNEALGGYADKNLNKVMHKFRDQIINRSIVVIGTQIPWVEAIALEVGASHITTLDYTRNKYENAHLEWLHVKDFLDNAIENEVFEYFDNAVSFSSIEHSGLGRYGDPLAPYGDFEAIQQIHCLSKPNAVLFLGLEYSRAQESYMVFNAHRIYGKSRLDKMFEGWSLEMEDLDSTGIYGIFVLRKKPWEFLK